MLRVAAGVWLSVAACAAEPDGLLVITDKAIGGSPAFVDVFVGVDRDLPFVPLTETRPLVLDALPDDRDVEWTDTSRPFSVLLDVHTDAELYVVLRGHEGGPDGATRFGADLRAPVVYPGSGYYSVTAYVVSPGDGGACPHGTALAAGYEVELAAVTDANRLDCDLDGAPYPEDCADYDAAIHPAPDYPASSGIVTPPALRCCNGDERIGVQIETTSSGQGSCNLQVGCPGAPPTFGPRAVRWQEGPDIGIDGDLCDCVDAGRHPLDCLAAARPTDPANPGVGLPSPYCDLAIEADGSICPDQVSTIRDRFRDFLPPAATSCPVAIAWQAGAVSIGFRGQGRTEVTLATEDCDADVVFQPAGPPPGPVSANGAFGWYIVDVGGELVPMHVHPAVLVGCQEPTMCGFE